MPYDFFRYLTVPPSSDRALFNNIRRCYSALAPERLKRLKPSSEAEIQTLEEALQSHFGKPLPSSFQMYLQQMGKDDDGLLSNSLEEDWDEFANGDLARGTQKWLLKQTKRWKEWNQSVGNPPYWLFYRAMLSETGLGFSPVTDDPNELIRYDGGDIFYTNDTLPKLLTYLTCLRAIEWSEEKYGKAREYKESRIPSNSQDIYSIEFFADCPREWSPIGHAPLVDLLNRLEDQFALKECWFSMNKQFDLLDIHHKPVLTDDISPLFTRYVSITETLDLMFSVRFHPDNGPYAGGYVGIPQIQVNLYGNHTACIRQIMSEILQQTKIDEISMIKIENR